MSDMAQKTTSSRSAWDKQKTHELFRRYKQHGDMDAREQLVGALEGAQVAPEAAALHVEGGVVLAQLHHREGLLPL